MHRRILPVALALLLAACGGPLGAASPTAPPVILMLSPGERVQAAPGEVFLGAAFNKMLRLAETNGDDLGYPWIDPSTGELIVSTVTETGRRLVLQAGMDVSYRFRTVAHGVKELQRVQDQATNLVTEGLPGAELIHETMPDHRDNRALLVIKANSDPLLQALATRFPEGTVAVEVSPGP